MKSCIYCQKTEPEVFFIGREHVIPRLMGTFENSPTIRDLICDTCNSIVFSKLENKFKEDTEEGIYYQMFNFENKYQVRLRSEKVKTTFSSELGDFFDEIFPFFKLEDGVFKVFSIPQIKIKKPNKEGYLVLLVKEVQKLDRNSREFKELKESLKGVEKKKLRIFTPAEDKDNAPELDEAISLLKDLGINYNEKERKFAPNEKTQEKKFLISMDCTVENDIGRVIAKIAFNYFIFCAKENKKEEILFQNNFDKIKSYITGEKNFPIKEIISDMQRNPIIFDEKDKGRFLGHTLTFREEKGNIIAQVSFLGKGIYTIQLGPIPKDLQIENFGSGHLFDPIGHKIFPLTQNSSKWGTDEKIKFGLFNRI